MTRQSGSAGSVSASTTPVAILHRTDRDNGRRLAELRGDDIMWIEDWGKFLVWNGKRWVLDRTRQIERWAKEEVPNRILQEAMQLSDDDRKDHIGWSHRSESNAALKAMVEQLKSEPGIAIDIEETPLNPDPDLLNCPNGTLHLPSGELRPHSRDDLITQMTACDYDPDAPRPVLDAFLSAIFSGEKDLIRYVQKIFGISVSGRVTEHLLPIFHGSGSNGKGTLVEAAMDALGDYAIQAADDLLLAGKGAHPTDKADLLGKRLVCNTETDEGRRLSEALVKRLTGGDTIRARRMKEDFWEFQPTHTLILSTNHKPEVRGTDNGIWRRLRLTPFDVIFSEDQQDKGLPEKLRAEAPGFLAMAVEGYQLYRLEGLVEPACVTEATRGYREEQDILAGFLSDCCVLAPGAFVSATRLYEAYTKWCGETGQDALTRTKLASRLKERGGLNNAEQFSSGEEKGRTKWTGIGIRSTEDDPSDPGPGGAGQREPDGPQSRGLGPEIDEIFRSGEANGAGKRFQASTESRVEIVTSTPSDTENHHSGSEDEDCNDFSGRECRPEMASEALNSPHVEVKPQKGSTPSTPSTEKTPEEIEELIRRMKSGEGSET